MRKYRLAVVVVTVLALSISILGCSQKKIEGDIHTVGAITLFVPDGYVIDEQNVDSNTVHLKDEQDHRVIVVQTYDEDLESYLSQQKAHYNTWDIETTVDGIKWVGFGIEGEHMSEVTASVGDTNYWVVCSGFSVDEREFQAVLASLK